MSFKTKEIKKIDKSFLKSWEQPKKDEKNFRPVPEKYYKEDEGLALASVGGRLAFEGQARRLEEIEREKEDERLALKIDSETNSGVSEYKMDPETFKAIKALEEESKVSSPPLSPKPLNDEFKAEIRKVIFDLKALNLGISREEFTKLVIQNASSLKNSKYYNKFQTNEFCTKEVNILFPKPTSKPSTPSSTSKQPASTAAQRSKTPPPAAKQPISKVTQKPKTPPAGNSSAQRSKTPEPTSSKPSLLGRLFYS